MRKKIIAGNWKMNKTIPEAVELAKGVVNLTRGAEAEVVVCPPYICIPAVAEAVKGTHVALGAQDVHWEEKGAFTGKISCAMLKSAGVQFVIVGHSEQRTYFHETNETVNKKVKAVFKAGLLPIICVGETLAEREKNETEEVVEAHIRGAYEGIPKDEAQKSIVAYEPVWAIGTGRNATPEQAQEVHAFIRRLLAKIYDGETASKIRLQYGGSMKPDNASELLKKPDVDGGLIGGAALKPEDFNGIVRA